MENGKISMWTNLIGFEKNDPEEQKPATDDITQNILQPAEHIRENSNNVLTHTLEYAKVTEGFLQISW